MKALRVLVPRTLEARLLVSYVGAFAVVIAIFAAAVWFSFVTTLNEYTAARLSTLARAGSAAMEFGRDGFVVDEASFGGFSVHLESEGLEWFDRRGRLVASRGKVADAHSPPHKGEERLASGIGMLDTYTITLRDPRGVARGFVRASMVYSGATGPTQALERGLVAGALLALLAGALGGALLARSSVERTEEGYRRLGEFIADASHELRSPLSALAGTASVALREAPGLAEPTRSRLESIGSLTGHMRRLVDDLLILARAERSMEHELFIVDLDALFADVCARHRQIARENAVRLEFAGPAGLEIYGNPDQIERIVANLVENALRYTAAGGRVSVAWTADPVRLEIAINDNGSGIAPADITRVFDRFWRGDAARAPDRGTGLGLAIALALARRHGGDIVAASELGKGSTFTVTLPRRPPSLQ